MKVILVRVDRLGDLLLCTPLMRALAKAGHKVDVVARSAYLPVLDGNPFVNASHALETVYPSFPGQWRHFSGWLRTGGYDVIILPHAQPKELLLASFFSGIKTRIAMWSGLWGRLTLHTCLRSHLPDRPRHLSDIILDCGRVLGVAPDGNKLDLFLPTAQREWAIDRKARLGESHHLVGIHPGCGGSACNLPAAEYGRLAQLILEHDDAVVVTTESVNEASLVAGWPDRVRQSTRFWDSKGQLSIIQLAALIEQMSLYVVGNTGPLHLASCVGATTVSPFCAHPPMSPDVWGNTSGNGIAVKASAEHCRLRKNHGQRQCDFGGTVGADDLYASVAKHLGWLPAVATHVGPPK